MAQFIPNFTICRLCGKPIADHPLMFPAFLPRQHSLWRFTDGCFHPKCFQTWDDHPRFEALLHRFHAIEANRPQDKPKLCEDDKWFVEQVRLFDLEALGEDQRSILPK
jgi:hypothetical protein